MSNIEIIYRLIEYIQIAIRIEPGVDSFNIYQSTNEIGPYTLLINLPNKNTEKKFKGKASTSFNPISIGWDNANINYLKCAPVIAGVEGAFLPDVKVYPLHYDQIQTAGNKTALFVFSENDQRWIPASTSMNAFS